MPPLLQCYKYWQSTNTISTRSVVCLFCYIYAWTSQHMHVNGFLTFVVCSQYNINLLAKQWGSIQFIWLVQPWLNNYVWQTQVENKDHFICASIQCFASYHPLLCDSNGDGVKHITAIGLASSPGFHAKRAKAWGRGYNRPSYAIKFKPILTMVTDKQAFEDRTIPVFYLGLPHVSKLLSDFWHPEFLQPKQVMERANFIWKDSLTLTVTSIGALWRHRSGFKTDGAWLHTDSCRSWK